MAAGQPTKYSPEMCETIIEIMKDGGSIVECCAEIDISRQTFYNWTDKEHDSFQQQFFDTAMRGLVLCQSWWEKKGRGGLENREFNANLFKFLVSNKFKADYGDNSDKDKDKPPSDIPPVNIIIQNGEVKTGD